MSRLSSSLERLGRALADADAVLVGAGAGLSAAAGYTYSGERFERLFADFIAKYHFRDMYSAGFYPYPALEEKWAYWSRYIYCNRYDQPKSEVHEALLRLIRDKDYFVLTTNVDHLFQQNGFDKKRLFYTQGDYGLWQCRKPCHQKTYDNEANVRRMVDEQKDMRIPAALVPHCPVCGEPMEMNLRADDTFVEDEGWHRAAERYHSFLERHGWGKILFLELGVGMNTPGIIKFPFWRQTQENPHAVLASINLGEAFVPDEIVSRSIVIDGDIKEVLRSVSASQ
ncbi:MAG: Sir2 silent information regulator family NAD-dependent deacetylase [Selenomonadaceae bacterium]|nr:Sir2 silent information regulator family NAD-dependent deacetylase [Selenomonadaceae bacterium]